MSDDDDKPTTMGEYTIAELIDRSSLGTPGAKKLRARTPQHVVDEILKRVTRDD
jgi:hypothetical protein